jgi:hypothetical protein
MVSDKKLTGARQRSKMQQEPLEKGIAGCMKPLLQHLLGLIFTCFVWYLFLGRKGLLVGIGAYIAIVSGKIFLRVFGGVPRK